jgi:hypothetical protein
LPKVSGEAEQLSTVVPDANNFADTLSLLTGTGNGSFNPQTTMVVGDRPTWVAVADFSGDARPDLAVVNSNSGTVTVINTPRPATQIRFEAASSATAGVTFQVTLTALDADGQPVPDYTGTVSFTSDDPRAVLPPNYTFTPADGGTRTFNVTLKTAGPRTVSVTSGFGTQSKSVQVDPAAASRLEFAVPTAATAGAALDVTVRAFDPFDNLATGFRGTVQFTSTDPNPAAGKPADYTFTADDAGTHTFAGGFTLLTAGTRTVTAAEAGLPTQSVQVTVSHAAASRLTMSATTAAQAGTPFNVTVNVFDPYGNRATGFTGTVQFTSTDPIADLPADYTFTTADQGARIFQVTLKRAGVQTVTVASAGLTGAQQTGIQVSPGEAVRLAFVNQPTNIFPNRPMLTPVTVQARDPFDNPVGGGSPVSLFLATNPTRALLRGVLTAFPDQNGVATFTNVTVTRAGTYTLAAMSGIGTSPASDPFTAYAATRFRVQRTSAAPRPTAGDPVTVTVTALDARGRPDSTYRGTVRFTSTDPRAVLPAEYTFTAADGGQHTFEVTLKTAGLRRVLVTDTTKLTVRGVVGMAVVSGAATELAVAGFPLSTRVNRAHALVVTALDQFGNRATGYTGTVTVTSNGSATIGGTGRPAAPAPVAYTFRAIERGRHVFSARFTAPGTGLSLKVTDQADAAVTGGITGITVV